MRKWSRRSISSFCRSKMFPTTNSGPSTKRAVVRTNSSESRRKWRNFFPCCADKAVVVRVRNHATAAPVDAHFAFARDVTDDRWPLRAVEICSAAAGEVIGERCLRFQCDAEGSSNGWERGYSSHFFLKREGDSRWAGF